MLAANERSRRSRTEFIGLLLGAFCGLLMSNALDSKSIDFMFNAAIIISLSAKAGSAFSGTLTNNRCCKCLKTFREQYGLDEKLLYFTRSKAPKSGKTSNSYADFAALDLEISKSPLP